MTIPKISQDISGQSRRPETKNLANFLLVMIVKGPKTGQGNQGPTSCNKFCDRYDETVAPKLISKLVLNAVSHLTSCTDQLV